LVISGTPVFAGVLLRQHPSLGERNRRRAAYSILFTTNKHPTRFICAARVAARFFLPGGMLDDSQTFGLRLEWFSDPLLSADIVADIFSMARVPKPVSP
jgi:hypothetical protein